MTRTHTASRLLFPLAALGLLVSAVAPAAPVEAQPRGYGPRLRLGVQGDIGYVREGADGLVLGATGQLGVQQSDLFAVYYQPRILAGSFFDGDRDAGVVAVYNTALFDFTLGDMLQLGVGPSLDLGVVGVCSSPNNCEGFGGAFFGMDFKVALAFGMRGPFYSRAGFVVALHVHPTWIAADRPITTVTLGFGFQIY